MSSLTRIGVPNELHQLALEFGHSPFQDVGEFLALLSGKPRKKPCRVRQAHGPAKIHPFPELFMSQLFGELVEPLGFLVMDSLADSTGLRLQSGTIEGSRLQQSQKETCCRLCLRDSGERPGVVITERIDCLQVGFADAGGLEIPENYTQRACPRGESFRDLPVVYRVRYSHRFSLSS